MDVTEFQQRMAALPEPKTELKPPHWEYWRWQLWQLAQSDDPANFTRWPCVYHTMLVEHWKNPILYELSVVSDFMPLFGKEFSRSEYHNLIHQAFHLYRWQQTTGRRITDLSTIVEFGGGYGAMALLARRLGFTGRYVIYDLPEFSLLQEWYLSQHQIEAEWNPKRKPRNADLFMALYSLSEVDPEYRVSVLLDDTFNAKQSPKSYLFLHSGSTFKAKQYPKSYLFLYSGNWETWDNKDFFQRVVPQLIPFNLLQWQHVELGHLPDRNNWYTFGW